MPQQLVICTVMLMIMTLYYLANNNIAILYTTDTRELIQNFHLKACQEAAVAPQIRKLVLSS